ncbi:acetylornithine deacetylase [Melittangium boletus DSM 14713]|uniref:Acetylornithine deacetylase n=1 Tax=Melittangium boletus DSM 14713 TaxID=1294270 RepID=A0A250INM5_9BACT|nr:acetylornithine deacetylase [Melittangium boletus DSM 14713]
MGRLVHVESNNARTRHHDQGGLSRVDMVCLIESAFVLGDARVPLTDQVRAQLTSLPLRRIAHVRASCVRLFLLGMSALGAEAVVFGPGDIRVAHQTGEFVPEEDLVRCEAVLSRAITHFCGTP